MNNETVKKIKQVLKGTRTNRKTKGVNLGWIASEDVWQVCPICNGLGNVIPFFRGGTTITTLPISCDVCLGRKIISKLTGKPPV
jgi:hypothetical protein